MKAVYVSRHTLLPSQERGVRELGLEIIRKIENLPEGQELIKLINDLKSEGIEAVITVALPPHLLASLSKAFRVFVFEMRSSTVPTVTDAEKWVAEAPERRISPRASRGACEGHGIHRNQRNKSHHRIEESLDGLKFFILFFYCSRGVVRPNMGASQPPAPSSNPGGSILFCVVATTYRKVYIPIGLELYYEPFKYC